MKKILVTFADVVAKSNIYEAKKASVFKSNQQYLSRSALNLGFEDVIEWNRNLLVKTDFYKENKAILDHFIGCGYWLWKPYIILDAIEKNRDCYVIYHDVGNSYCQYEFKRNMDRVVDWCEKHYGFFAGVCIPQYGENKQWTKRDCFYYMGCDSKKFWNSPQFAATFSVWRYNDLAIKFLLEWLRYCKMPECLLDGPNVSGLDDFFEFEKHRHDQSILTNLIVKYGLCFPVGDKDINKLDGVI